MAKAQQHLQQGQTLFQMGDVEGAMRELTAAADLNIQHPACYAMLGICHLQLGQTTESIAALQQAKTLAPNDPEIAFLLGSIYGETDQPQQAKQELQRCVDLDPRGQRGREAKAMLDELDVPLVETPEALKSAGDTRAPVSEAVEREQSLHFARVCLESGLERRARNELETILDAEPDNTEAWELLAQAFEKLGEPERAEECRQKAAGGGGEPARE